MADTCVHLTDQGQEAEEVFCVVELEKLVEGNRFITKW